MIWDLGEKKLELETESLVIGILNATPDSFSDGGKFAGFEKMITHGFAMFAQGAALVDVGGESTRPGAAEVPAEVEIARVEPVVRALVAEGLVSIDTSKAEVARAALEAGACVVNDVTGLRDEKMVALCVEKNCGVVVMHMQGDPRSMQREPNYVDVVAEVREFFENRLEFLMAAGIAAERICFDPGIGFGKKFEHNLALLRGLRDLKVGGRPILLGVSRKSFFGEILGSAEMADRSWPTVAVTAWSHGKGVRLHRVHEVKGNVEALRVLRNVE